MKNLLGTKEKSDSGSIGGTDTSPTEDKDGYIELEEGAS